MKSLVSKKKLEFIIEIKRKVMCKKAIILGFTHPEVVKCSQELDVLLNSSQKRHRTLKNMLLSSE